MVNDIIFDVFIGVRIMSLFLFYKCAGVYRLVTTVVEAMHLYYSTIVGKQYNYTRVHDP